MIVVPCDERTSTNFVFQGNEIIKFLLNAANTPYFAGVKSICLKQLIVLVIIKNQRMNLLGRSLYFLIISKIPQKR